MKYLLLLSMIFISSCSHMKQGNDDSGQVLAKEYGTSSSKTAQENIDICLTISEEDRSRGSTAVMREGSKRSIECMKNHIFKLSEHVVFKNSEENQEKIRAIVEKLYYNTYALAWILNNSHDKCEPCGSMYHVAGEGASTYLMEEIIRDLHRPIDDEYFGFQDVIINSDY